ncbi:Hypothetical predicted protein [Olea europaea subsp. europaea]|uniref:Uncharacterized protein n=1 Tax=Olea europaea subsp. europaea TaxID=158383 RepID=A0A8S0TJJ9_OLEEU|nr:Hypothetical predicted protein [Olea europaea subsp. europaea]
MAEHNKAMAAAKTEKEKYVIVGFVPKEAECYNWSSNLQQYIGDGPAIAYKSSVIYWGSEITLLWEERTKASTPSSTAAAGKKRNAAANGSNRNSAKRGRGMGGLQNLLNKAFEGLNGGRAGGRGGARGGEWRGRGRGRSYR